MKENKVTKKGKIFGIKPSILQFGCYLKDKDGRLLCKHISQQDNSVMNDSSLW